MATLTMTSAPVPKRSWASAAGSAAPRAAAPTATISMAAKPAAKPEPCPHSGDVTRAPALNPRRQYTTRTNWQKGEIAFLKPAVAMEPADRHDLVASGYIPERACCHPVIVLERAGPAATHCLVTTVSAYSASAENNFVPPWRQRAHSRKHRQDFRAFDGSVRPPPDTTTTAPSQPQQQQQQHALLRLCDGRRMPKPRASWVYVQTCWVVPVAVLGHFDKAGAGPPLRMTADSLADLRSHMAARSKAYDLCLADPRLAHQNTVVARPSPPRPMARVSNGPWQRRA